MTAFNETKISALQTLTTDTGHINKLEILWLEDETGETGTLNELWHIFWDQQAVTAGPFNQRAAAYLTDQGYTGTLPEMWYQFWAAGGPLAAGSFFLLESGDNLVLEDGSGNLLLEEDNGDAKVSELDALAAEPADTDQFYINDGGVSKRIAWSVIKTAMTT